MGLGEDVKNILESILKIAAEKKSSISSVDRDFAERAGVFLEKYSVGHLVDAFRSSADAIAKFVLFFEDYVDLILKGLEFFSNLVSTLGIKDYYEIIRRKVRLEEVIQPEKIDLDFLKFQIGTLEELFYPHLEESTAKTIKDLELLRKVYTVLGSETVNKFMEEIERQERSWDKLLKMINLCFLSVRKETDVSICINQIIEVINEFILFADNLRKLAEHITRIVGSRTESPIEGVKLFLELIRRVDRDLIVLVNCRARGAEYLSDSFFHILAVLWGSREIAAKKFQSFIRSEISLEELLPPNFSIEDLGFALVQVRSYVLQAAGAHKRVKETVDAMKSAADYFDSPVLREYYHAILKEIEIINKYLPQHSQNLVELQDIIYKHTKRTI
ncbi:MAG: hypothetical protein QXV37_04270 [Candidatus Jordarchaeaceae archaeon]